MSRTYNKLRGGFNMLPVIPTDSIIEHPVLPMPVMDRVGKPTQAPQSRGTDFENDDRLKSRSKRFDPIQRLKRAAMKSKKITYKVGSSKTTPKNNLLTSLLSIVGKKN